MSMLLFVVGWMVVAVAAFLLLAEEVLYRVQSAMNRTVRLDEWILRHRRKVAVVCLGLAAYIFSGSAVQARGTGAVPTGPSGHRSEEIFKQLDRQQALIAQIVAQASASRGEASVVKDATGISGI